MVNDFNKYLSDIKLGYLKEYLYGGDILDVGSGYCYYTQWLLSQDPSYKITAVDMLDLKQNNSFTYIKKNLEELLDFDNETFSSIMAFDVIEHIQNERQILNELFRVCMAGGVLIGSVPHDQDKFLPDYNLTFKHRKDLTHKRYYEVSTLERSLELSGFDVILIEARGIVSPKIIAEFAPNILKLPIKKIVGLLEKIHFFNNQKLASDLFFVATKINLSKNFETKLLVIA